MAITEILEEALNWTSSSLVLPSFGYSLVRLARPKSEGGGSALEVRTPEVPPVMREANEIAERAWARGASCPLFTRTHPESPRIVLAPRGFFLCAGLGTPVGSQGADFRQFTVQDPPISVDPTPRLIERLRETAKLSHKSIAELVGVSRQSLHNWQRKQPIASENRRRLMAVLDILNRARKRYSSKSRLYTWLQTPCTEDGKSPWDLILAGEYDRARYYAVASPTSGVRSLPDWATRPVPVKFAGSVRVRRQATPAEPSPENTKGSGQE